MFGTNDMETFKVYISKIGTWIDDNAFGGHYVDEEYQKRKIKEARERWKETIKMPLCLRNRIVDVENYIEEGRLPKELEYYEAPNPYYGWKEEQLEIIVEK